MGRKSRLRSKRKAAGWPQKTLASHAIEFQKLLDEDFVQAFKTLGYSMLGIAKCGQNGTLFHSLPSVQRVRAMMNSKDSKEQFCGHLTMSFLSFGMLSDFWCELEVKNATFMRMLFVHLCKQEFIAADHRENFEVDASQWGGGNSIIGQLLNGFAIFSYTLGERVREKKRPFKGLNTGVLAEGLRTHLVTSVLLDDRTADCFLFKQGRVCLYKSKSQETGEPDMVLAIQSEDGLWAYFPDLMWGSTPIKDLAALREWVRNYDGPSLPAKTIDTRSARLLEWLGFEVTSAASIGMPLEIFEAETRRILDGTFLSNGTAMTVTLRGRPQKIDQNELVTASCATQ